MNFIRNMGLIILCMILGLVLGAVGAFIVPKQYVSSAEVAVDAEALSSDGLARFERLNIADSVEVATLVQLLKSSRISHAVASQVGLPSHRDVEDNLKIVNDQGSPIVKIKVAGANPSQAQAITRGVVEQAVAIDSAKREQSTEAAIKALRGQISESEKQLDELNQQIQKLLAARGSPLSNEQERQQRAATELAQHEERLASLNVEGSSLQDRLRRLDELIGALPVGKSLPAGFEIQEADRSPGLAETRQRLLAQESKLASLRSRYGARHAQVQAAEAEVSTTGEALRRLVLTQREVVRAAVVDNTKARRLIEDRIAATEKEARASDLSLDPGYANLRARRDSAATAYSLLTVRLSELSVFAAAHPATFYVFSPPTLPDRASLLRPGAMLALGAVAGALIGACLCARRWSASAHAGSASVKPAYAAP